MLLLLWFNKSLGINIFRDIWCKIGIISLERDAVYYVTFINYYPFFFLRCKSNTMELEMQFFTENEIKKKRSKQ